MKDREDKEIPKRQPRIFKTSEPFCKIEEWELEQMKVLGKLKRDVDVKLLAWRKADLGWWQWRARRTRRHEMRYLRKEIVEINGAKEIWWERMRTVYNFSSPAIVSIMRGEIILGTPKEGASGRDNSGK